MSNCLLTGLQTNFIQSSGKFRKILAYIQEACRLSTMTFEMSTFCALGFVSLFGHFPSYGKLNFIWLQVNCSNKRDLSFVCVFLCFFLVGLLCFFLFLYLYICCGPSLHDQQQERNQHFILYQYQTTPAWEKVSNLIL